MGIYIKGMEMPKEKSICVEIFADGGVHEFASPFLLGLASELPPHGRLGDLDALIDEAYQPGAYGYVDAIQIENAPTIIPAEEGEI